MASPQQQLLEAINALYHHPDEKVKKQANQWLEDWQQTLDAWSVSDAVLHDASASMEAHYFTAQTLRTKVQRDFEELPPGAVTSLRDSLIEMLLRYFKGAPPVRTQLCLAVAALQAHLPAAQWGEGGVMNWLVQRLGTQSEDVALPCMLEMLTVLPQEGGSYRPAVRPERRKQMVEELIASAPQALQVLSACLNQHGERLREQVLEAFGSWLKLCGGAGLDGATLAQHPLVIASLEGLQAHETFDAAVDAVVELIFITSSQGMPDQNMFPLVEVLVPRVLALRPRFAVAAQRAQAIKDGKDEDAVEHGNFDDDDDTAKGMARVFAEVGEAYTALIATGSMEALKPVQALLEVAAYPEDNICAMSFNFWHRLARHLTSEFSSATESSADERRQRQELFVPTFEKLVALIRGRVRFPDNYDKWHHDEKADFKRSRYAVGDTLQDAAAVLGADRTLRLLLEPLQSVSAGGQFDWRTAEAALYCIRAVHKSTPNAGDAMLLSLFASLPQLPQIAPLQYTAAMTVAGYADWLAATLRAGHGQDIIPQLLQMLTQGLTGKESAGAAAVALRHICDACAQHMGVCLEALMQLYQRVQSCGTASTTGSSDLATTEADVQQVIEAAGLVVSALPADQRRAGLQALLMPILQPLEAMLQQPSANGSSTAGTASQRQEVSLALVERLTTVFKTVSDPHAVAEAYMRVMPLINAMFGRYGNDARAVETISRAPRYALRTAGKASGPMVNPLLEALPQQFAAMRHSSFLYVASELIKIFGQDGTHDAPLGQLFERLMTESCAGLRSLRDFNEHPDIADDTFLLAARALNYCPRIVYTPQLLPVLLDTSAAGILVQHRDACISVFTFLTRLLDPATLASCAAEAAVQLQAAFLPRAPLLMSLLLAGATGGLPHARNQEICNLLFVLLKVTGSQGLQLLAGAVSCIPDEAATAADRMELLQVANVTASLGPGADNLGKLEDAIDELSELCRRHKRAREAVQRALLPAELYEQTVRR
ncbi:hypothetical protein WJX72_009312 [[Myrmecia] bisecta]|uniref:Importin N-terminal domain-containing protein n=1 Tax=[Myrmecia] bisecta TaxID=41462 RepID=A0AAW1R893_9CHLO